MSVCHCLGHVEAYGSGKKFLRLFRIPVCLNSYLNAESVLLTFIAPMTWPCAFPKEIDPLHLAYQSFIDSTRIDGIIVYMSASLGFDTQADQQLSCAAVSNAKCE
eukprot:138027-Amphidinium_carterae.1